MPTATGISASTIDSGIQKAGDQVTFTITTNKPITLTPGGSAPVLTLSDGEQAALTAISTSGTTLTFALTVATGADTSDLTITSLNLNGGTLNDNGGLPLDISAIVNASTGIAVDSLIPATPLNIIVTSGTDGNGVDDLPTLSGTADPNTTIKITDSVTGRVIGTTTVGSNGAWSLTTSALAGGSHQLTATATDAVGNVSAASAPVTVLVGSSSSSTSSPMTVGLASDTGVSHTDGITSNPTLTGAGAPGSTVTISNGATVLGTTTVGSNGVWSYTPTLADGSYSLTISGTDAQGNASLSQVAMTLDTAAPTINAPSTLTNSTPILTGTASAGSTVTVLVNGSAIGTTTAATNGTWSLTTATTLAANSITSLQAVATTASGVTASSNVKNVVIVVDPTNGFSSTVLTGAQAADALGAGYLLQLASGTEAVNFLDGVLSVGETTHQAYLARLYEGLLGRTEDSQGISFWNNLLDAGTTDAQIAQFFLSSPEYLEAHSGLSDTQFVISLYQGFLNRSPSAAEISNDTTLLQDGASRAQLLTVVADSSEAQTTMAATTANVWVADPDAQVVTFIYETTLGRAPDAEGLQFWTAELKSGISPVDMMKSFVQMPEYLADHQNQSTGALIDSLYQNALGRQPTAAELTKINQQLQSGKLTTGSLIVSIAQSNEAYAHLFKTL